jgi:hypothetical protein
MPIPKSKKGLNNGSSHLKKPKDKSKINPNQKKEKGNSKDRSKNQ